MLCNMDRVNMSIAILPMADAYGWDAATVGLVQSSFFWGYLLTQVAGGVLADKFGGKRVLGGGVVWWSLATALTPLAAQLGLPALLAARAAMGVGEGVAMPAMNNLLSRWIPVQERSRSLALVYSGMYCGSVLGLALSPHMIHAMQVRERRGKGEGGGGREGGRGFAGLGRESVALHLRLIPHPPNKPAHPPFPASVALRLLHFRRPGPRLVPVLGGARRVVPVGGPGVHAGGARVHRRVGRRAAVGVDADPNPVARPAVQGARVGVDRVPLLPQLGHLHPADVDADVLCAGERGGEREREMTTGV
jgi:MFS family permease